MRDVVDFLEFDVDPEYWIRRLIRQIDRGTYEPSRPTRFTLAKSRGLSRTITFPGIPDLVLYRAIVDDLYAGAKRREHRHVYFEQRTLSKISKATSESAMEFMREVGDYGPKSLSRFLAWLRYDQYRKYLIFDQIYPFVVTSDITNFFDTVLYNRIADSLYGLSASPRMIGLLFFLLERLSIRDPYSESPRIGLPVDEFDCSRKLAHIVLFPHDDRMVKLVGEDAYLRWMDDQNIGVSTREDGYKVISEIGRSVSRIHLSPNAQKTKVLSLQEARRYFHLDINKSLDELEKLPLTSKRKRAALASQLRAVWKKSKRHHGIGEWSKVLKRVYRLAGLSQTRMFRRRALGDILETPSLARRIADYMRCTGSASEYLTFAQTVWGNTRQLYPDVNLILVESLLRLEPDNISSSRIRSIASSLLRGTLKIDGAIECAAVAPLLILRFGDRRSLPLLRSSFEKKRETSPAVVRAAAVVYASYGISEFRTVRRAAASFLVNNLADLVRLIERIRDYRTVPGSYKARLNSHFDPVKGIQFVDTRSMLAGRLLLLNNRRLVRNWLEAKTKSLMRESISSYDKAFLLRFFPMLP